MRLKSETRWRSYSQKCSLVPASCHASLGPTYLLQVLLQAAERLALGGRDVTAVGLELWRSGGMGHRNGREKKGVEEKG